MTLPDSPPAPATAKGLPGRMAAAVVAGLVALPTLVFAVLGPPGCHPDCRDAAYYGFNSFSGLALLALGGLALLRPTRRTAGTLGAFLLVWGAQAALSNVAASSTNGLLAAALFGLAQLFVPLQAMLLLAHAAAEAKATRPALGHDAARWALLATAALAVAGGVAALLKPAWVLTVAPSAGGYAQHLGPLAVLLFQAPRWLGVGLALALLSWQATARADPRSRSLVAGLAFAWSYAAAYALRDEWTGNADWALLVPLALALLLAAVVAPLQWVASAQPGTRARNAFAALATLGAATAALAVPHGTALPLAFLAPGVARLLAVGWLLPALWPGRDAPPLDKASLGRTLPLALSFLTVLTAASLMGAYALGFPLGNLGLATASSVALASLALVGSLGVLQVAQGVRALVTDRA